MKILLLGKNGQVGQALQPVLASLGEVTALDRSQADFDDPKRLRAVLAGYQAEVIVNAAAYTAVDRAEEEVDQAFRANAVSVDVLAEAAARQGALLVHYSTDYVFDGKKTAPYQETDVPNPLNVYGKSKLAGEMAVRQSGCQYLVFRTSWVYSPAGKNFINTIWRLAREREALDVVADQVGAPTSALLIAEMTARAVSAFFAGTLPQGLYHLTASGETSWHGLASYLVQKARGKGAALKLDEARIRPIATEDYPLPALRPKNSRLNCALLSEKLGVAMPEWKTGVDALVAALV
ncbi:MAG: dTDP-4-dehydrorhamnose reductase [Alistipes senegalensis]|nr:dTDP-4-dehydrorhamnose reductase [Oxalobacter formigenes]MCM1281614.1 dTDP-4-dehydrorhamnose reductase [Alistipes senegalensis]